MTADDAVVPFPDAAATPKQVRKYLTSLLVKKHDVEPKEAEEIAARWKLGRGKSLILSERHHFSSIFSPDVGPYMYSSMAEDRHEQWSRTAAARQHYCKSEKERHMWN